MAKAKPISKTMVKKELKFFYRELADVVRSMARDLAKYINKEVSPDQRVTPEQLLREYGVLFPLEVNPAEKPTEQRDEWTVEDDTKKKEQFPPPFSTRRATLKKLVERYALHENPDPPPCPVCGLEYRDLDTGLDYQAVFDLLWVADNDPQLWRHKGRHSVLGLWHEIKQSMWADHVEMCADPDAQEEFFDDWTDADFQY